MDKVGICLSCGKLATRTCRACGAAVCSRCVEEFGCKACKGKKGKGHIVTF